MHAVDTNVLLRYLTRDDEAQHEAAARYLEGAADRGDFADYLIRERALSAGCDAVITFDRVLHQEPGFIAPA